MDVGERTQLQIRMLGDIAVAGPGVRLLAGPAQRRTFAALVAHRNETTTIDQLVDACWPNGDTPRRAEHNVRTYVHRLRGALGEHDDRIETSANGYRLRLEADETDLDHFERLERASDRLVATGDLAAALDLIDEATALWRGRPYAEFADEHWVETEVIRLCEAHHALRERQAEALLGVGRPADAVAILEQLVRDEPYRERPQALLMRALYESGRQTEALRAFQDFRRFLIDDAGVEPSPDLVDLDRRIASGTLDGSGLSRTIGNFELHERIGEGAFAVVHRATQASLGREVAVKIVRAELANRPEFIRRFEAEAQMIASIEHPSVVPLYDYWREPGHAYLVMRWMTGGSLETRLDHGPLGLDAVVELVDAIAGALDVAHAHDIVHRDVKPANILFDDAGRSFLGDFGIALASEERSTPQAALSEGSPIFASPEQLRREPAGPEADVHALGIVAFTALTGRTPFHDAGDDDELLRRQLVDPVPSLSAVRPDTPVGLDDVIATATAKRPGDRYPTAGAFAAAFRAAATGAIAPPSLRTYDRSNPYLGLRAFTEADVGWFHGRARLVDELVGRCADPDRRLLAVVGPSGSGKSSVAHAGLLPALRSGRVPGSADWFITTMIPGAHPYEALEAALLRIATNPPAQLLAQLRDGDRGIHRGVSRVVPDAGDTVLVVIDQFEELFTSADEQERRRFLRALAVAATEPGGPLRVVTTMRADFYDQPLSHPEIAPLFTHGTVAITPLAPDELEEAITAPAATVGVGFEPGLVAEIITNVSNQPGALPLLQYALTQTFDAGDGSDLTVEAYRAVGGLTGALATRADELFEAASPDEQGACRRVFGRLVTPGDGVEDTRRRADLAEVATSPAAKAIIERFGEARLLTFDCDPVTREPRVEIAHEALIREWPRLRRWLDDDRERLREHRRLTAASAAWRAAGDDPSELYRGGRLETAESLLSHDDLTDAEASFLTRSLEQRTAEAAREEGRLRRLRRLVAGLAAVVVVAVVAGVVAGVQWNRADDQSRAAQVLADDAASARDDALEQAEIAELARADADASAEVAIEQAEIAERALADAEASARQADVDRLRSSAIGEVVNNSTLGLLLAAEAYRIDPGLESADTLHRVLTASDGLETTLSGSYGPVGLTSGGSLAVAASATGIDVWELRTKTMVRTLDRELRFGSQIDISGEAGLVAVSDVDGTDLVSIDNGATVFGDDREFDRLSFSADGRELALFADGTMQIWNLDEPSRPTIAETREGGYVNIAWHPDDRSYALLRIDGTLEYRDRGVDEPRWEYFGLAGRGGPSIFTSDGATLAITLGGDGNPSNLVALSVADGAVVGGPMTHSNGLRDLYWIDEAALRLAATINSADLEAWDLVTGEDIEPPVASRRAWALEYSDALDRIVETGPSGLRLWRPFGASPLEQVVQPTPEQLAYGPDPAIYPAISSDGSQLLVSVDPYTIPLPQAVAFDLRNDAPVGRLSGIEALVRSNGGYTLLIGDQLTVVDDDFEPVGVAVPNPGDVRFFSVSPNGETFTVYRGSIGRLVLYRTSDGSGAELDIPGASDPNGAVDVSYSADGERLSAFTLDGSDAWAIFDTATAEVVADGGPDDFIRPYLAGDTLYVSEPGYRDFTVRRLDPATFEPVGPDLVGHVINVSLVADDGVSPFIATSDFNGTIRVWDRVTGMQVGREIDADGSMQLVADGTVLMVLRPDGVAIWNYDTETWLDVACEAAGRNLTSEEWDEFGPRTFDRRATCPDFALE